MKPGLIALLFGCLALKSAGAETNEYSINVGSEIPDGSTSGLVSTIHVPEMINVVVEKLTLSLELDVPQGEVGFSGDLYGYLQHGDDIAVLINRPGRGSVGNAGYSDNISLSITFSDDTPIDRDIHNYRMAINGDNSIPLTFPLTGLWQPDGRATDPDNVLLTDPRTAFLAAFEEAEASGDWTLFLADVSSGGQHRIIEWSITLQTVVVPEPSTWALILTFGFFTLSRLGKRRG